MVAPTSYDVTILVNDVDVTQYVPAESMSLDDYARQVSTFRFTIENPTGITPQQYHTVVVTADSLAGTPIIFTGYIFELKTRKRDNGITMIYECDCQDRKALLQRTIIGGNDFTGSDVDILGDLLGAAYPDLSDLFDFSTDVNSILADMDFAVADGTNLLDALNDLADQTGADWRMENTTGSVEESVGVIDFDGGYSNYTLDTAGFTAAEQSGGNPDNAYIGQKTNPANGDYIEVAFEVAAPIFMTDFAYDIKIDVPVGVVNGDIRLQLFFDGVLTNLTPTISASWVTLRHTVDYALDRVPTWINTSFAIRLIVEDATPTAGSWTFGIDNVTLWSATPDGTIDFDGGAAYTVINTGATLIGESGGGNPADAYEFDFTGAGQIVEIQHDLGAEYEISGVGFHAAIDGNISSTRIRLLDADSNEVANETIAALLSSVTWNYRGFRFEPPITAQFIRIRYASISGSTINVLTDNIAWQIAGNKSGLQWNEDPDAAGYDIDVQSGDEYASDIDYTVGSLDNFNSVTVIGGYEEVAIEKALDNDGVRDHIGLPYPVKALVVYKNTGTDTAPTWGSALALGAWGSDTLISGGGTKDALLDAEHNVLMFDTAPSNLVNAYKITGTIQRPIRVRVENVTSGEPVLATSYVDEKITSVDQAVAIAQGQLEQKNAMRQLSFKTNHPGLKPGQAITVADSARGLSELVTIRRISTTWQGKLGFFEVDCGDDDENSVDAIIANNDRASRASGITTSPDTQTLVPVTDDSGVLMTDDSGDLMYYIA